MDIAIYFTDNESNLSFSELIYSETITNTQNVNRVFKLSGKNNGNYKFVYSTEGRVFTKEI